MQAGAGLLERLQKRVCRFDAQELSARDSHDPPGALVRTPRSEGDRFAHAIDPDLDALGIDREQVRVKSVQRAAARFAGAMR